MVKIKYLWLLILLVGLAVPLTAKAGCCKKITWERIPLPMLDFQSEVFEMNTEQQCLGTCQGSLRACQNFFRKDAMINAAKTTCLSATNGCCQVTVKGLASNNYSAYWVNDQPECNIYCTAISFCESVYHQGQTPNPSTGLCEVSTGSTGDGPPIVGGSVRTGYQTLPNPLGSVAGSLADLPKIIGRVINALLSIIGAIALLIFVYGGFTWMTAAGNEAKVAQGKNILLWATIAIIIIFLSWMLVAFFFQALGV